VLVVVVMDATRSRLLHTAQRVRGWGKERRDAAGVD
jgi:hypothetical protein